MTTLAQYRQRMVQLDPKTVGQEGGLGRTFNIEAIAVKSVDVAALKIGGVDGTAYTNKWMVRAAATGQPVNRVRRSYDFDGVLGRISHNDTDYADLTATTETLELLEYEPFLLDDCIQQALHTSRFRDVTLVPMRADGRYSLTDIDWIESGANVRVGWTSSRVLSRNRHFEKWNGYQTQTLGNLAPDFWTPEGDATDLYTRTTDARRGVYALRVTSGLSGPANFTQTIDLGDTGVDIDSLRNEKVTVVAVAKTGSATTFRVLVTDGVLTTFTDYHTGSDTWEELSAEHTISPTATNLLIRATVAGAGKVVDVDEFYLVFGALDDTVRRDVRPITWVLDHFRYEQGQPLLLDAKRGRGHVLVVESERPYAQFDASRVIEGTADADESDAPLDLIAFGALYRFYETQPDTPANRERFLRFRRGYFERRAMNYPAREPRYGALDSMMPRAMSPQGRIR